MLTAWADAGRAHGGGRLGTAGWVTWGAISVALTAVSIPTHAALYGVIVPIAFVLGILQGGSVLLAAM